MLQELYKHIRCYKWVLKPKPTAIAKIYNHSSKRTHIDSPEH